MKKPSPKSAVITALLASVPLWVAVYLSRDNPVISVDGLDHSPILFAMMISFLAIAISYTVNEVMQSMRLSGPPSRYTLFASGLIVLLAVTFVLSDSSYAQDPTTWLYAVIHFENPIYSILCFVYAGAALITAAMQPSSDFALYGRNKMATQAILAAVLSLTVALVVAQVMYVQSTYIDTFSLYLIVSLYAYAFLRMRYRQKIQKAV